MKWTLLLLGLVNAVIVDLTEENQGLLGGFQTEVSFMYTDLFWNLDKSLQNFFWWIFMPNGAVFQDNWIPFWSKQRRLYAKVGFITLGLVSKFSAYSETAVQIGRVNCEDQEKLSQKYRISKYPTIKIFRYGIEMKKEYRGTRTAEDFLVRFFDSVYNFHWIGIYKRADEGSSQKVWLTRRC